MKIKVLHLIPSLENGGAERILSELVLNSDPSIENTVCCIFNRDSWYSDTLKENNIKVVNLQWSLIDLFKNVIKLIKLFRGNDIIHCWLYYAMALGVLFGFITNSKVIWNIRQSAIEKEHLKTQIFYLVHMLKYVSWYPSAIISCSERTLMNHKNIGYQYKKMILIPNFTSYPILEDDNKYISDKYSSDIYLCVGRNNPIKNHENLINAFSKFSSQNKNVQLWIVGYLNNKNSTENIRYFDKTKNIKEYYKKAKYLISTSYSEGFPNVILEAMTFATPVIATDAGDSFKIIDNSGLKIRGFEAEDILKTLDDSLLINGEKYHKFSRNAKRIVSDNYKFDKVNLKYKETYEMIVKKNVI